MLLGVAEIFGEGNQNSLRAAQVTKAVNVFVIHHFAEEFRAVFFQARHDIIHIRDGKHHAAHAQCVHGRIRVGAGRFGFLKPAQFNSAVTVLRSQHDDVAANAFEGDEIVNAFSFHDRLAFDFQAEFDEKRNGRIEVFNHDADVVQSHRRGFFSFAHASGNLLRHRAHAHFDDARLGGLRAGHEHHGGDILGVQHFGFAHGLFGAAFADGEFRFHAAGTNHTHLDAVRTQFAIERLREAHLRELGHAIHRLIRKTVDARHRGNHQDGAGFLLQHDRDGVPGEQERRFYVGIHQLVVFGGAGIDETLVISRAGVVEQNVDATEGIHRGFHGANGGVFFARIAGDDHDFAAGAFNFFFQGVEPVVASRGEDEVCTGAGKGAGRGLSDTSAGTGDDGCFSVKFVAHVKGFLSLLHELHELALILEFLNGG